MPLTRKDIEEQREQAQEDILTILDGTDRITDSTNTELCQVIVRRMNLLIAKLEGNDEDELCECGRKPEDCATFDGAAQHGDR